MYLLVRMILLLVGMSLLHLLVLVRETTW